MCVYIHAITIVKKEVMNLKKKERYVRGFGGKEGKEML